jgi:plasmid stabilization system protein ParE
MAVENKQPKLVIVSPQSKEDIRNIVSYLSLHWNQEVIDEFIQKLEIFYYIVSINPRLFGYYNKTEKYPKIRR